jgi:large subunit ribosomal protein L35
MPKMKTNRAARKRFGFTGSGKIRRRKGFHNHILTKKSTKRKRSLRKTALVHSNDEARVRRLLPYGG